MKTLNVIKLCLVLCFFMSCQNDDWKEEIDTLKKELDIQQQLIKALQNKATVQSVIYTTDGYIITFSDNSSIVLGNNTPLITQDNRGYWLLNDIETDILAQSADATPIVSIGNNNNWFIDGQDTGIPAQITKSSLVHVFMDGNKMVFLFEDDTKIYIDLDIFAEKSDNDICLPQYTYMLSDIRNNIFVEPFIKRWRPQADIIRFSSATGFARQSNRYISIDQPKAWQTIGFALYNSDFDLIKGHTSIVRLGNKGVGTKNVYVQIIGDSFVQGAFFKDALLANNYVPNIKMVGLRKVSGEENQYDEGRGGDMLQDYFNIHTAETKAYQGYMHPDGNHTYYGSTGFWKNCYKVMNGNTSLSYSCGRFDDFVIRFDDQTGYLLSPKNGDVQYDNTLNSFVEYRNGNWVKINKDDYTWSFNYKKYLTAWNIPAPHFLGEMLGLNDFRDNLTANFAVWNAQIEIMKNSYLDAVPNGKFMIIIPSSTCGSMNNANGDFTLKQNAAMWHLRKNIIDVFDKREAEGYYLVDVGITIDNEDGYNKDENGVQIGNPHPYPNYPTMGIPVAAFIQFHREK